MDFGNRVQRGADAGAADAWTARGTTCDLPRVRSLWSSRCDCSRHGFRVALFLNGTCTGVGLRSLWRDWMDASRFLRCGRKCYWHHLDQRVQTNSENAWQAKAPFGNLLGERSSDDHHREREHPSFPWCGVLSPFDTHSMLAQAELNGRKCLDPIVDAACVCQSTTK